MIRLRLRVGSVLRQRGITAKELADQAGIAVATARALALGENERLDVPVIERVAAALQLRPLELFEEIEVAEDVIITERIDGLELEGVLESAL